MLYTAHINSILVGHRPEEHGVPQVATAVPDRCAQRLGLNVRSGQACTAQHTMCNKTLAAAPSQTAGPHWQSCRGLLQGSAPVCSTPAQLGSQALPEGLHHQRHIGCVRTVPQQARSQAQGLQCRVQASYSRA